MNVLARIDHLICLAFFFYCLSDLMNELKKTATNLELEYELGNINLLSFVSCAPIFNKKIQNMTVGEFSNDVQTWARRIDQPATIQVNATYGFRIKNHFCMVFSTGNLTADWTLVHTVDSSMRELAVGFIQSDPSELLRQPRIWIDLF